MPWLIGRNVRDICIRHAGLNSRLVAPARVEVQRAGMRSLMITICPAFSVDVVAAVVAGILDDFRVAGGVTVTTPVQQITVVLFASYPTKSVPNNADHRIRCLDFRTFRSLRDLTARLRVSRIPLQAMFAVKLHRAVKPRSSLFEPLRIEPSVRPARMRPACSVLGRSFHCRRLSPWLAWALRVAAGMRGVDLSSLLVGRNRRQNQHQKTQETLHTRRS